MAKICWWAWLQGRARKPSRGIGRPGSAAQRLPRENTRSRRVMRTNPLAILLTVVCLIIGQASTGLAWRQWASRRHQDRLSAKMPVTPSSAARGRQSRFRSLLGVGVLAATLSGCVSLGAVQPSDPPDASATTACTTKRTVAGGLVVFPFFAFGGAHTTCEDSAPPATSPVPGPGAQRPPNSARK